MAAAVRGPACDTLRVWERQGVENRPRPHYSGKPSQVIGCARRCPTALIKGTIMPPLSLLLGIVLVVAEGPNIETIAGTGEPGRTGDGGPAAQARLNMP